MKLQMKIRSMFSNPNCLLSQRNRHQFLVTLLVNLATFCHGLGSGWMSPTMRDMQTENSPVPFPIYVNEISWIGSIVGLGSVLGNIFAGLLQDRIGRKFVMYCIAVPYTCFWLLMYFAQSVEYIYVARLLAGITGGSSYVVLPTFISEIADPNIRGRLGSMILLSVNTGILAGYIVSTNVAYFTAPLFIIVLPICYFISNFFFPETPNHLIKKGKILAAENSFRFYKNLKRDDISSMTEFEDLKSHLIKEQNVKGKSLNCRDFVTKAAFKAYATAFVLLLTNQFCGSFCVTTYVADIFTASHTTLDVNMCTIIIGVMQIVGNYVTTLLCDKYGRRILMLVSTLGASLCLMAFGLYTYFAIIYDLTAVGWLPVVILSFYVFLCNVGLVGCLFVVLVEVFPNKIRTTAVSTFVVILSFAVFITLKIFPLCVAYWGISVTMWCCSGFSLFGFIYFFLFLEETKGKSLLES